MDFYNLDLSDNVLDALDDMRFETCTPIQEKCIPEILNENLTSLVLHRQEPGKQQLSITNIKPSRRWRVFRKMLLTVS